MSEHDVFLQNERQEPAASMPVFQAAFCAALHSVTLQSLFQVEKYFPQWEWISVHVREITPWGCNLNYVEEFKENVDFALMFWRFVLFCFLTVWLAKLLMLSWVISYFWDQQSYKINREITTLLKTKQNTHKKELILPFLFPPSSQDKKTIWQVPGGLAA